MIRNAPQHHVVEIFPVGVLEVQDLYEFQDRGL